ncbi:MAG TPA: flavohemoglobin expression-modulating QEGLA motif protein [Ignavibacteria bacterium]|nr:flavohemoglobin expression-modulating QEGLA motif protein [Ignavibacteria bacterium]
MKKKQSFYITDDYIEEVCTRLHKNKRVRRPLPGWGRIHIDRRLPFLCVYRKSGDEDGAERFVTTGASFIIASDKAHSGKRLSKLVYTIVEELSKEFKSFLIIEIWSKKPGKIAAEEITSIKPRFRIIIGEQDYKKSSINSTLNILKEGLDKVTILKQHARSEIVYTKNVSPAKLQPILGHKEEKKLNCHLIGVEINPVYLNPRTGAPFPVIKRSLSEQMSYVFQQAFFEFTNKLTTQNVAHYHELGKSFLSHRVIEIDKRFAQLCNHFDFLKLATPINEAQARRDFQRKKYDKEPVFFYRPVPFDPTDFKKELWNIPLEEIEDPAISQLFYEKREELDIKVSMLDHLDTPWFHYGSMQLYGVVGPRLSKLSSRLLSVIPPHTGRARKGYVSAAKFRETALQEIQRYKEQYKPFLAMAEISEDMYSGLMVSQSKLQIGKEFRVPQYRVDALLQHEVGTHLVTYFNGLAQPFSLLHIGFAGYDELQEGLAVLAEFLVDGLSPSRLRMLAGRVKAAEYMIDGAGFVDTFNILVKDYGFSKSMAFTLVMRIYRGGGLTKDIIYLRGLLEILEYIKSGGNLEPLYVGKISYAHIPIINELQLRGILKPAPVVPEFFSRESTSKNLEKLKKAFSLVSYAEKEVKKQKS